MKIRIATGLFLGLAATAIAADADFNGRWDLTTVGRPRAWWVELSGVGTPQAGGKFVSAYGGDLNILDKVAVENGELVFTVKNPSRNAKGPAPEYRAKMVGGKLVGTVTPGTGGSGLACGLP